MTIPDDSFTVQQLMDRMLAGIPTNVNTPYDIDDNDETGHEDEDLEAFSRMDITEKEDILKEASKVIEAKRRKEEKEASDKKKKDEDEAFEKRYTERKKKDEEDNEKKTLPLSTK